nr:nucleotidyltransferase family protein [uncultured Shewanella sp.]
MSFWPEKETAVAIRQTQNGIYECLSAFDFDSLFQLLVTYTRDTSRCMFSECVKVRNLRRIIAEMLVAF